MAALMLGLDAPDCAAFAARKLDWKRCRALQPQADALCAFGSDILEILPLREISIPFGQHLPRTPPTRIIQRRHGSVRHADLQVIIIHVFQTGHIILRQRVSIKCGGSGVDAKQLAYMHACGALDETGDTGEGEYDEDEAVEYLLDALLRDFPADDSHAGLYCALIDAFLPAFDDYLLTHGLLSL